jgi:putative ABC transport system permease protein
MPSRTTPRSVVIAISVESGEKLAPQAAIASGVPSCCRDPTSISRIVLSNPLATIVRPSGANWSLNERRRTYAIATALGANQRQLGSFVWAESAVVTGAGIAAGCIGAWALSNMLVKVLHGVFDPAPDHLSIPWTYLAGVAAVACASTIVAATAAIRSARTPHTELLRAT